MMLGTWPEDCRRGVERTKLSFWNTKFLEKYSVNLNFSTNYSHPWYSHMAMYKALLYLKTNLPLCLFTCGRTTILVDFRTEEPLMLKITARAAQLKADIVATSSWSGVGGVFFEFLASKLSCLLWWETPLQLEVLLQSSGKCANAQMCATQKIGVSQSTNFNSNKLRGDCHWR